VRGHRVGTGFDAHRLSPGRTLILGGVEVPHDRGLLGHSDGDCLVHALCDALLGAACLGEMGTLFPSSDPRWKGASSLVFLEEVRRLLGEKGFTIVNVDATVIAEAPALSAHLEPMRVRLSRSLSLPREAVSIKAKSTDGLGSIGRGDGIAAQAVAMIQEVER
jgi:2-C-methyl-D-erythritol 2,4-cyclodiphosphate synthase